MTNHAHHPSSNELAALREPIGPDPVVSHLDQCVACRIRFYRLRDAAGVESIGADALRRVMEASAMLPEAISEFATVDRTRTPRPNEIWRVGRDEALLVWVRRVFDDDVADVVPLVLDVELADEDTILIDADATPIGVDMAAMVALRTHVHPGSFLNRIGDLDIADAAAEVITAIREGRRASRVPVGSPIDDGDDQRIEFRQALRDLLAELSPSAWTEIEEEPETKLSVSTDSLRGFNGIVPELIERLPGLRVHSQVRPIVPIGGTARIVPTAKVVHLAEVVVVALLEGHEGDTFPEVSAVAEACEMIMKLIDDANAIAISIPRPGWPARLITRSNMRSAVGLPSGSDVGPTWTISGFGVVDTLCKHLEGASHVWEVTEPASAHVEADIDGIAKRRAIESLSKIFAEGERARQDPKKRAWTSLPDDYADRVARFVMAVVHEESVDDAIAQHIAEVGND